MTDAYATEALTTARTAPRAVCWQLPAVLQEAIEHQASTEGVLAEVIAARTIEAGLTSLGLMPHGRCSVRTGLCGSGPAPLPMQQNDTAAAPG